MKPIRIVIADDHNLVRAGIRSLLQSIDNLEVVGEAVDGREALNLIKNAHPDVALMDIAMPGMNGLEATARAVKTFPNTRIIILSMYSNDEYITQALRAGATGYLLKDSATAELELALRAVVRGETYLSPAVSKQVVANYLSRGAGTSEDPEKLVGRVDPLTPRQREILQLIAEGHSTKVIARLLNLSIKTIETHRTQMMARLNIHDIAGLVRYAIRTGLVDNNS